MTSTISDLYPSIPPAGVIRNGLRLLGIIALALATLAQTACNTTAGAGRDVSAVGRGVTNAATGR